jgi:heat shock protein HslJ
MRLARLTLLSPLLLMCLAACMSGGSDPPAAPAPTATGASKQSPPAADLAPDGALQAHAWQLAGTAVVAPRPWLEFTADGKVRGDNSCNGFSGGYTLNGSALGFGPLAQSKRFCTQTADQERAFMEALRNTQSFRMGTDQREQLELLGDSGQVLLVLEARSGGDGDAE